MPSALAAKTEAKKSKSRPAPEFDNEPPQLQYSGGATAGVPRFMGSSAVQFKCAKCQEEGEKHLPPVVQTKCACCGGGPCEHGHDGPENIRETAQEGVAGASQPLPHFKQIQSSFGRHDVGSARTQTGGAAASANESMGSLAYTAGDRIAFRSAPDVKLAAHEAAHVVQQRSGAKLQSGVGRPGDPFENQADEAAEAVARGESAEPILNRSTGAAPSGSEPVVQHKLAVSAARTFEPAEVADKDAGSVAGAGGALPKDGAAAKAAPKSQPDRNKKDDDAGKEGDKNKPGGGGAKAQAAPAPQAAPTSPAATPSQPGAGKAACSGTGKAECYTDAKDDQEPANQDNPPQSEPPATTSKEQVSADEPDVPEPDKCPAETALAAQSPEVASAAAQAAPEAKTAAGAGGPAKSQAQPKQGGGASGEAAAAAPGGGPPAAAVAIGNPLESAVASAGGQRGQAVAGYLASSAQLSTVADRTSTLRAGTEFTPTAGESSDDAARRAETSARANRFFGGVADQLDTITGFASDTMPDRLGARADAAKAQIATSIEQQKNAISARIAGAKHQSSSEAAKTIGQIRAGAASVARNATSQAATAVAALHASHTKATTDVDRHETQTLDQVNQVYAAGRARQEQLGVTIGDDCVTRGNEFAAEYKKCRIDKRDSIMKGHLTDRRAEAQMNAAHETANGFKRQMIDSAKSRARDTAKAGRQAQRCAVIAAAKASHSTLDSQTGKLIQSLESGRDSAIQSAAQARDSQIAAVQNALRSTIAQLDRQEHEQRQAADDTGFIQQAAQEQTAHTAAAALQKTVSQAAEQAVSAMADVRARLVAGGPPDPDALDHGLTQGASQVSGMLALLRSNVESGSTEGETQLGSLGRQGISALDGVAAGNDEMASGVSSGFTGSMAQISEGAGSAFADMRNGYTQQAKQTAKDGDAALSKAAAGMQQACTAVLGECDKDIDKNSKDLEQSLRQNKQQMECEIPKKADEAASKEAPAWKAIAAIVLVIVVIIIMVIATVVTFGAGGIVAGIIVGAIVGAVTSGMLYAASVLWNNQKWSWGDFGRAVGVGALTGAIGGGLGAWAGGAVKGMSIGIKLATTVGVSVLIDVGTQFFTNHMSFKNFSFFELGTTILIAIVTFGIGHKYGGRINIGGGKGGGGGAGTTGSNETNTTTNTGSNDTGTSTNTGNPEPGTTDTNTTSNTDQKPPDQPASDQPKPDQPAADQPASDQPKPDQPAADQPASDQPKPDQPAADQPASDQPKPDQPAADQPASDQPKPDQPAADQPASDQPKPDQPAADQPASDQPKPDQPAADQPASDQPKPDQPGTDHPVPDRPTPDQPAPKTDQPMPDQPAPEPEKSPTPAKPEMTPEQIEMRSKVKADLKKLGIEDPMFDDMDAIVTRKVRNALGSDPLKKVPQTQEKALKWALEGAGGDPGEFANRYEYAQWRFGAAKEAAVLAKAKDPKTAAAAEITPEKLTDILAEDNAKVQKFGPAEHVAPGTDLKDVGAAVQSLDRVAFQSDTAESYHAVKHRAELPAEFQTGDFVNDYQKAYNDTIKTGTVVRTQVEPNGSTSVVIQKTYGATGVPMEAIIYVKPDGTTVLASYGQAKAVK